MPGLKGSSIEEAIRASGVVSGSVHDAGYRVAYAVAQDRLRRTVIADSRNPLPLTPDAWIAVANSAPIGVIEIEVKCSDAREHRRRVEWEADSVCRRGKK